MTKLTVQLGKAETAKTRKEMLELMRLVGENISRITEIDIAYGDEVEHVWKKKGKTKKQ